MRGSLLALQVAVSTVLLVSASLLTRGLVRATTTEIGFDYRNLVGVMMSLPPGADRIAETATFRAAVRPALATAGFNRVTMVAWPPLSSGFRSRPIPLANGASMPAIIDACASDYFAVLGVPIVIGRTLSDDIGMHEAVVNEAYVRDLLGGGPAIGTTVLVDKLRWTIVGVAADARLHGLDEPRPDIFLPLAEENAYVSILVRDARPDAATRLGAVIKALRTGVQPGAFSLSASIIAAARNSIFSVSIVSGIGLLALALATLGVFGVFAYLVEERRREIGIRLALGARQAQVVGLVLGSARSATIGGLAVGLGLAAASGGLLRSYLFGLSPLDPLSYLAVAAILAIAATIATALPARRAARIDPALTLRAD
jgi:hypothetical protein